jgi:hypothetical protein
VLGIEEMQITVKGKLGNLFLYGFCIGICIGCAMDRLFIKDDQFHQFSGDFYI